MDPYTSSYPCIARSSISTRWRTFEFRKDQIVDFNPPSLRVSKKLVREKWSRQSDPRQFMIGKAILKAFEREANAVRRRKLELRRILTNDSLEAEFRSLVNRWKAETFYLSSLTKKYAHPAYQRIIAMGTDGLPLVLTELQRNNGNWFYALKFMAGRDVAAGISDFEDAKAAWLEWGYNHNYI